MKCWLLLAPFLFLFSFSELETEEILRKIEEGEIRLDPYPYLVIDDFLPQDFYEKACRFFPEREKMKKQGHRHFFQILLPKRHPYHYSSEFKEFWKEFNIFFNCKIKPALVKKFQPHYLLKFVQFPSHQNYIHDHFKTICNTKTDVLTVEERGYGIQPHVDQFDIYLKLIFYFPDDTLMRSYGTVLLSNQLKKMRFEREDLIEYLPNRLLVTMQTPISWHCVRQHHFSQVRRTYNANVLCDFDFLQRIGARYSEELKKQNLSN